MNLPKNYRQDSKDIHCGDKGRPFWLLQKFRWQILSIFLFSFFVLVLTGIDYIIHADLYNFGLQFSLAWANPYWVLYFSTFQFVSLSCALIARSWRLLLVYEMFSLCVGQDLVFYLVWNHSVFYSGEWSWMLLYHVFGTWQTIHQISLVMISMTVTVGIIIRGMKKSSN